MVTKVSQNQISDFDTILVLLSVKLLDSDWLYYYICSRWKFHQCHHVWPCASLVFFCFYTACLFLSPTIQLLMFMSSLLGMSVLSFVSCLHHSANSWFSVFLCLSYLFFSGCSEFSTATANKGSIFAADKRLPSFACQIRHL